MSSDICLMRHGMRSYYPTNDTTTHAHIPYTQTRYGYHILLVLPSLEQISSSFVQLTALVKVTALQLSCDSCLDLVRCMCVSFFVSISPDQVIKDSTSMSVIPFLSLSSIIRLQVASRESRRSLVRLIDGNHGKSIVTRIELKK